MRDSTTLRWRRGLSTSTLVLALTVSSLLAWGQETPPAQPETPAPTPETESTEEPQVFRGAITVNDSPIVEGSKTDTFGSLVTTVSDQQIDDLYAQDLTAVLRRVPGVVISRYNPIGSFGGGDGGAFFIRGHGSGRPGGEIMMLTDGIPRFVGIWTHPLIDLGTMDTVHQVEIYRSAQPVLLGNMAFGAVDMASKRRTMSGSGGRFVGSYGTYDTIIGSLEYGGLTENFDYYLTAGHRQSDGHRDDADGDVNTFTGRLGYRFGDSWTLSLLYEHTSSSVNDPGILGAPADPITPNYDIGNNFVLTTLGHAHGAWTGTMKLYLDDGTFDWLQWSGSEQHAFRSVTDSSNYGFRWRETVSPWADGELVFGLDHDLYGGTFVERHPDDDHLATGETFRTTAPYLMVSHTFAGDVTVTPSVGVRFNNTRYFGNQWGGQAGITLGIGNHSIYANWAHAFNLPGVYSAVQYGGWGRGDTWQDLEAETLDHMEVGWVGSLSSSVRVSASLFRDQVDNAIRFVPPPPPPPEFANIGAYTVNGLEVSVNAEASSHVALFVGGTVSDTDPATVPNLPKTTAVGGMTWNSARGLRLNLDIQWIDDRFILNPRFAAGEIEVSAYFLANAKLGIPLRWLGIRTDGSIFVFGENLTDEDYEYRIGYPMPGRMLQFGLEIGF